ncbi:MAG: DUF4845 domain-containing protein [Gammaproteobacteria bacterium]|nr:DUF4845 domain-containing protein [Gammaproteobacteria bacterium]
MKRKQQQGIGTLGLLIVLAALGSLVYVGFKIAPAYLEQQKVRLAQESVAAQPEANKKTRGQLEQELLKRLQIDDVDGITRKELYITKEGGQWQIRVTYQRSISLFEAADVVLKYDETVAVQR